MEDLVLFAKGQAEGRHDALETVYPLLSLQALSTDVKHMYPVG